jgi:hypothetical protein
MKEKTMLNSYRFAVLLMMFFGAVGIQASLYEDNDPSLACTRLLPAASEPLAALDHGTSEQTASTKVEHQKTIEPTAHTRRQDEKRSESTAIIKLSDENQIEPAVGFKAIGISNIAVRNIGQEPGR